jgi:hypothetical protein
MPVIGDVQVEPQFTHGRKQSELHILQKIPGDGIVRLLHVGPQNGQLLMQLVERIADKPARIDFSHNDKPPFGNEKALFGVTNQVN